MQFELRTEGFDEKDARSSIQAILDGCSLCSIATTNAEGTCHINTVYFAFDQSLTLVFLSDPQARHCQNIGVHPQSAITVFSTDQPWGEVDLKGLQLLGSAFRARGEDANRSELLYRTRFKVYADWIDNLSAAEKSALTSEFFMFVVSEVTILDEAVFGEETFVPVRIERASH